MGGGGGDGGDEQGMGKKQGGRRGGTDGGEGAGMAGREGSDSRLEGNAMRAGRVWEDAARRVRECVGRHAEVVGKDLQLCIVELGT